MMVSVDALVSLMQTIFLFKNYNDMPFPGKLSLKTVRCQHTTFKKARKYPVLIVAAF